MRSRGRYPSGKRLIVIRIDTAYTILYYTLHILTDANYSLAYYTYFLSLYSYNYVSDYGISYIDRFIRILCSICPTSLRYKANNKYNMLEFYIRYITSLRCIVDIICISPIFYNADIVTGSTANIYYIKAFLVVKLSLTNRIIHSKMMNIIKSFDVSIDALVMLGVTSIVACILFGSFMYYIERGVYVASGPLSTGIA